MPTSEKTVPSKINVVRWAIGLPVGFFAVLMLINKLLFTTSPDTEAQWIERETIRQCWKSWSANPKTTSPSTLTQ